MQKIILIDQLNQEMQEIAKEYSGMFSDRRILVDSCDDSFLESLRKPNIAIVGTRHPTPYGERICRRLVRALKPHNVNIVSGGAMGIDRIAHEEALNCGLSTQAWVVGPLVRPSPRSNARLFAQLAKTPGSALLTPWKLEPRKGTKLLKSFWIQRNHWLVAASDILVIIEALEKSGTWSTTKACAKYNIDAFAVPGPIDSPQSCGTNLMISSGYAKFFDFKEILTNSILVERSRDPYNLTMRVAGSKGPEEEKGVAQTTQDFCSAGPSEVSPHELLKGDSGFEELDSLLSSNLWGLGGGQIFRKG